MTTIRRITLAAAVAVGAKLEYNRRNLIVSDCIGARSPTPGCVDSMCVDLNIR